MKALKSDAIFDGIFGDRCARNRSSSNLKDQGSWTVGERLSAVDNLKEYKGQAVMKEGEKAEDHVAQSNRVVTRESDSWAVLCSSSQL